MAKGSRGGRRASGFSRQERTAITKIKKDVQKELNKPAGEPWGYELQKGDDFLGDEVPYWMRAKNLSKRGLSLSKGSIATVKATTEKSVLVEFWKPSSPSTVEMWVARSQIGKGGTSKSLLYNDSLKKYAKSVGIKVSGGRVKTETIQQKITAAGHKVPTYDDFGLGTSK